MSKGLPLEELRSEHDVALAVMREVRDEARAITASAPSTWSPGADKFLWRLRELRRALLLHFRKEEEALFPDVRAKVAEGAPAKDILGAFFGDQADDDLKAHHLLRQRTEELLRHLQELQRTAQIEAASCDPLAALADSTLDLLQRHAEKEHRLVFPMIERLLDDSQIAAVRERMRAISLAQEK